MRIAIIDCGTNTFHLFVVEVLSGKVQRKLFKTKATVKLGEGGIASNHIAKKPFKRGIAALQNFSRWIKLFQVDQITAFGTAALRNAGNGEEFVNTTKEQTGISLELISGEREAELIYYGVRKALNLGQDLSLIMDIGGGSTEFIIGNSEKISWSMSFPLGAALLLEQFHPADPISSEDTVKINNHLGEVLVPLFDAFSMFQPEILVGSSGSFESLAEMIAQRHSRKGILAGKTEYEFNMSEYHEMHNELLCSTRDQREKMKGLVKMRVDMIVLSSLLLTFVLDRTGISKMKLSTFALKEGILAELMEVR